MLYRETIISEESYFFSRSGERGSYFTSRGGILFIGSRLLSVSYTHLMMVMFTLSIVICFLLTDEIAWKVISIIMFYFIMNIAYCIRLKRVALIDVFIIAIGFVLRIWVGGIATGIGISQWIVLMTFLLALFLAFAKRRDCLLYTSSIFCELCNIYGLHGCHI